jgi:hypothetical protein
MFADDAIVETRTTVPRVTDTMDASSEPRWHAMPIAPTDIDGPVVSALDTVEFATST